MSGVEKSLGLVVERTQSVLGHASEILRKSAEWLAASDRLLTLRSGKSGHAI
jgi:hypothetical protein